MFAYEGGEGWVANDRMGNKRKNKKRQDTVHHEALLLFYLWR